MLVQDEIEERIELLSLYTYIYVHTLFYSRFANKPRFQGCVWRSCCCNRNFWDRFRDDPSPFFPQGRARERTNERILSTAWKKIAGQFLSPVGREWNESVTSTRSYRPLLGRAPAAVTLATHVHFLLHRKGRVSPRRGAVCATRLRHFLSTGFSSLTIQPSPDIRSTTLLLFFHPQNSLWKIS